MPRSRTETLLMKASGRSKAGTCTGGWAGEVSQMRRDRAGQCE